MKFPKPRLRQVFEHSTHFKVVSPGGKNVTIAKKALSPQLTTRLRRFAQGGEVGHYAKGIEASDEAEAEAVANVAAGNAAMAQAPVEQQPLEEVPPQTFEMARSAPTAPRRPVAAAAATGVTMTAEDEAAQKLAELRAQEEAERRKAAQPAPAAPAPVVVNVNTAPVPTPAAAPAPVPVAAKAEAPAEKPAEAAPAPARNAAPVPVVEEKLKPPPVEEAKAPPVTIPPAAPVLPKPDWQAYQQIGGIEPVPGLLASQLTSPAPYAPPAGSLAAQLASPIPSAVAPVAALAPTAPVAAPAITPAGLLSPTPMLAPVPPVPEFTPVTVEQVRKQVVEEQKATPNASQTQLIQSAVSKLTGGLTLPDLELQAIADLSKQEPKQIIDEAIRDRINAKQAEAQAAFQTAVEQAQFADQQYKEALAKATRQQIAMEELEKRAADLRANAEANDDIKSFWGGQGFWRSVLGIAALAVSGYTAGYAGTENFAYKAFENAVARDVDEQKRKRNNRWKQYEDILGDKQDAAKLYGADLKEVTAAELERMAKTGAVRMVGPRYNELITQIRESAYKDRIALALKEGALEARETEAEAAMKRATRPVAVKPPSGKPFAETKLERESTINVAGEPLEVRSPTAATTIQEQIITRTNALRAADKVLKSFKEVPLGKLADVLSGERGKAIAELNFLVERFPEAFGFKRAISLSAAKQLKAGLQDPAGWKAIALEFAGDERKVWAPIQALRDDIAAARDNYIITNARPGDEGKRQARAALEALRKEDAQQLKTGVVPLPVVSGAVPVATPAAAPVTGGGWRSVARPVK